MFYAVIFHFHLKNLSSSKNLPKDPRIYEDVLDFLGLGNCPHLLSLHPISAIIVPVRQDTATCCLTPPPPLDCKLSEDREQDCLAHHCIPGGCILVHGTPKYLLNKQMIF